MSKRAVGRIPVALIVLALASPAAGQMFGHGMPRPGRPLHARLALADAIAIGTVDRVGLGRIAVGNVLPMQGEPGTTFELKRSPATPPRLAPGDRVLLILRGARTPYVLVDEPDELLRLSDAEVEARWRDALAELLTAGSEVAVRDVYLDWIDGTDGILREAAAQALADRRRPLPLGPELARDRARIALDPERPLAVRRASASVACMDPEGTRALLAGTGAPGVDASVVQLALAMATIQKLPGLARSVRNALRSSDRAVQMAGMPAAGVVATSPGVRSELERIAAGDDPELRKAAQRALGRATR